ncbi:FxsA family protein [Tianweitania aestuarii]|uniref:FxsA family protein n=1 Tax=Tianweitania aestuarii TaxID=2814886 RepID=UPI00202318AA|nr:FxsA family protein [Tianweitania aestuarii]
MSLNKRVDATVRLSIFPLIFLGYILLEIAVFILVGDAIGVLPTLGLILLSGVVGIGLMRVQGFGMIARMRTEQAAGRVPGREVLHGFMILLAGILLLLPGFVTDILGLLLFIPAVRDGAWNLLKNKLTVVTNVRGFRGRRAPADRVVDLDDEEFHRTEPRASDGKPGSSPWIQHDDDRRD